MTQPAITIEHLSKRFRLYHDRNQSLKAAVMRRGRARYEDFWALRDVSLEIAEGVSYGFIGTNGSGKSTLLKCLARILEPDEGSTRTRGKVSALLELGAGFHPELSGRENVYLNGSILGLSRAELDRRFDDIVEFAGLERFIDTPVKNYSSGMYVRLGFSVAINVDPDILLVDEVLAVGDEEFQGRCNERFADLRAEGRTIVVVSHSLGSVQAICDQVAWLDAGVLRSQGDAGAVVEEYLTEVHRERGLEDSHATSVRWGSHELVIEALEVLGPDPKAPGVLRTGDRATFRFHYRADARVERPVFVAAIHTLDGLTLSNPNMRDADLVPAHLEGTGYIDLQVDALPLVAGTYDLSAAATDDAGLHVFDHRHRAHRFEVEPGSPRESGTGLITMLGRWSLDRASQPLGPVIPRPGRVRVVVLGEAAPFALDRLRALEVPNASVEVVGPVPDTVDARNRAATAVRNDYLVFVRGDVEVSPGFIEGCVEQLRADPSCGLVGLAPDGTSVGGLTLFVSLDVAALRHLAFHAVGGFDARVPPVVAGLDLGWRLWMEGYRVRSAGAAPIPTSDRSANADELRSAAALVLASVLDDSSLDDDAWSAPDLRELRTTATLRRRRLQIGRRRGDGELLPLAHRAVSAWAQRDPSVAAIAATFAEVGAPERAGERRRIAVVTADTLAPRMAGPGIRAREIAQRLAKDHDVVLASTGRCDLQGEGYDVRAVGERSLRDLERWCDVLVFQGWVMAGRAFLVHSDKVIVADVYDPMHLEQLEQSRDAEGERGRYDTVRDAAFVLNEQLGRADFMLCASEKQRDLWLGQLAALNRINPVTYDGDESLRSLLAVVPFGVGDVAPTASRSAIRGTVPGIGADDKIVLWGGGVYNWFDPLTLLRAVDRLRHRIPTLRLYFLGMRHPNPEVREMQMAVEARRLADELGLVDKHVFFNHDWVAFDERQDFLLDADVGVSTHLDHIETEFSFRTRILDYLWAGLPILATDGDSFASVIRDEELGVVVPAGDVEAVERGLERLLTDAEFAAACRANVARISPDLSWSASLEPLVDFCRAPRRAADVACRALDPHAGVVPLRRGRRHDLQVAWAYLRAGGPRLVAERAMARVRRNRS